MQKYLSLIQKENTNRTLQNKIVSLCVGPCMCVCVWPCGKQCPISFSQIYYDFSMINYKHMHAHIHTHTHRRDQLWLCSLVWLARSQCMGKILIGKLQCNPTIRHYFSYYCVEKSRSTFFYRDLSFISPIKWQKFHINEYLLCHFSAEWDNTMLVGAICIVLNVMHWYRWWHCWDLWERFHLSP